SIMKDALTALWEAARLASIPFRDTSLVFSCDDDILGERKLVKLFSMTGTFLASSTFMHNLSWWRVDNFVGTSSCRFLGHDLEFVVFPLLGRCLCLLLGLRRRIGWTFLADGVGGFRLTWVWAIVEGIFSDYI
ncbi:hypothetical protein ACJX0J_031004, partial [Zea mays]